jgi:hypothetical protein
MDMAIILIIIVGIVLALYWLRSTSIAVGNRKVSIFDHEALRRAIIEREIENQDAPPKANDPVRIPGPHDQIVNSSSNADIIRLLGEAIEASNAEFQVKYTLAEQALIAKFINLLILSVGAYVAIGIFVIISFFHDSQSPGGSVAAPILLGNLLGNALTVAFVIRVINLAWTFLAIRRLRMQKQAFAVDAQLSQGEKIIIDLKTRAKTIRVGPNGIFIGGDNTGTLNTGTTIQIHQGAAAADVIALLLAYTKDNSEAHRYATILAIEMEKQNPNKSVMFSSWNSIVALLPRIVDIFDLSEGIAKLLGL